MTRTYHVSTTGIVCCSVEVQATSPEHALDVAAEVPAREWRVGDLLSTDSPLDGHGEADVTDVTDDAGTTPADE